MKKTLFLIITCITLFQSCNKVNLEDEQFAEKAPEGLVHWDVIKVEGPSTSFINQPITLVVTYPTSSGCDYVSKFVTVVSTSDILVKAYGNTIQNSPCTLAAVPQRINYEFTPNIKGQFKFKFINRDNSIISHIITIN